ncbi:MAG: phage/plasmid replication protein [Bacteroidota bacterium]
MYDTITATIVTTTLISPDIVTPERGRILKALENHRTTPTQTGKKITGYIKNVSFQIFFNSDSQMCRVNFTGSLNKFIHGNNFTLATRKDAENAIKNLSRITGLPLHEAKVTRIDFGACFIMKFPVITYLLLLDGMPSRLKMKKDNYANETIYFRNKRRRLIFYDKAKQNKEKCKDVVPSEFKNKYVLRYELRYLKALREQFNMEEIMVSDLYDIGFYNRLKKRWGKAYFKIIKYRIQNFENVKDLKSLVTFLILNGVEKVGGYDRVLAMIDAICLREKIDATGKCRIKKKIREMYLDKNTSNITKEIKELNRKIRGCL